jgi:hypothetical protein
MRLRRLWASVGRPSTSPLAGARHAVPTTREYHGSVLLIVTGRSLDPTRVTALLRMRPFQTWRRGETRRIGGVTVSPPLESGWKAGVPASARARPIEDQLKWWVRRLAPVSSIIRRLQTERCYCRLSWYMVTEATVSIVIPNEFQRALAKLNLHWEISMAAHKETHRRAPAASGTRISPLPK